MAFERIGIGGFLKFDEKQAMAGMARARKGFARLRKGTKQLGAGLSQVGAGLLSNGLAFAPITAGIAAGIKTAAGFEKQMSAVGAITRSTDEDLAKLTAEAKRMGVVSVFSAQESAEAMEFLGRAGFDTDQIITGLGGVMNAAAAEGIDLATSADIIAQSVKIMGLEAGDAAHNADVLALASAKSNTNIIALGEALKFGGLSAKGAGLSIEETTAVFGKLADAGLRGSTGGTSFANMLNKLNRPSTKAADLIKRLGIKFRDAGGRLLKMPKVVENFREGLGKLTDEGERNAAVTELFGTRGQRAYQALAASGGAALQTLTTALEKSSEGQGAAAEAAEKRLDNFLGSIKLFGSSLEAATIEFFGPFLGRFKDATKAMTQGLNAVLFAVQGLQRGLSETELDENEEIGQTARLIAQGVLDAVKTIQGAFDSIVAKVREIGQQMEESIGKDRLRQFVKFATIGVIVAGALAPVLMGIAGMGFVLKSVFSIFFGFGKIALGVFNMVRGGIQILIAILPFIKAGAIAAFAAVKGAAIAAFTAIAPLILPILAVMAVLTFAFLLFRKEGESVGDTFRRLWGLIKAGADFVWTNAIQPFLQGFVIGFDAATGGVMAIWDRFTSTISEAWSSTMGELGIVFNELWAEVGATFTEVRALIFDIIDDIFGTTLGSTEGMADGFRVLGGIIGFIVGFIADVWASQIGTMLSFTIQTFAFLVKIMVKPFRTMLGVIRDVIGAVRALWKGDFLGFFGKISSAMTRILTLPFQIMMEGLLKLLNALPSDIVSKFVKPGTIKKMEAFAKHGFAEPPPIKQIIETETKGLTKVQSIAGTGFTGIREVTNLAGVKQIMALGVQNAQRAAKVQQMLAKDGLEVNKKNVIAARNVLRTEATQKREEKQRQERIADKELRANVNIDDKRETTVNTELVCDGEAVAKASAKHKENVFNRTGGVSEPFNRGMVASTGVRTTGKARGA